MHSVTDLSLLRFYGLFIALNFKVTYMVVIMHLPNKTSMSIIEHISITQSSMHKLSLHLAINSFKIKLCFHFRLNITVRQTSSKIKFPQVGVRNSGKQQVFYIR